EKITPKTKAIILVHLYGMPANIDEFIKISKEYNLKLIEDCAQAFGSEYKGRKVGSFGDFGCFSFFPAKTLGAFGDGGLLVTDNRELADRIKLLRNHGRETKYYHKVIGFNSRLDSLQAGILRVKLRHIDKWIKKRIGNAWYYNKLLKDVPEIVLPTSPSDYKHSFNYYTIRLKNKKRPLVEETLRKNNVACAVYYPLSLHLQPAHKDLGYKLGDFPEAESAQEEVLSLPMYPELTKNQIRKIVNIIKKALTK
ncbi:MAG: DegT/DnrJ/EryC1/StrS family aminotransferase, partial [Candidatus Omnitrophica bacterium]|nr:DegT/DnrJ/EryC1/StrS family aminotransferase [Candidatus Omnitrophota bacterium]